MNDATKLRDFIQFWMHQSRLQTYGDREKFRRDAIKILNEPEPRENTNERRPHNSTSKRN